MSLFAQAARQVRFASGLRGLLRHTLTLYEARAFVQRCLEQREANVLRLLEEGMYRHTQPLPGAPAAAPKPDVNAENHAFGVIETRACGYPENFREVFSFGKLIGASVTLVGSDMVRIVEDELPARYGNRPLDYHPLDVVVLSCLEAALAKVERE